MICVSGLIRRYVEFLERGASVASMINTAEKLIQAYFSLGFRKEVFENVEFKNLLLSLVANYPQAKAYEFVDGITWKFTTGESSFEKRYREKKPKTIEDDLKNLSITDKLWKSGDGIDIEIHLKNWLKKVLSTQYSPSEMTPLINNMLYKETGPLKGRAKDELIKNNKIITKELSTLIKNIFSRHKSHLEEVWNKEDLDVLSPDNTKIMNINPVWMGIDNMEMDKVDKFVKKSYPEYEYMIFENLIYGNPPLSETGMIDKLKKEKDMTISQQDINRIKMKILAEIKKRFFPGVPVKKPVEIKDIKWTDLNKDQLDDFLEFLDDELDGKDEILERVKKFVQELVNKGGGVKEIADRLGVSFEILKKDSQRFIKPAYEKWIKENVKTASAVERLLIAMDNMIDYDSIVTAEQGPIDYDSIIVGEMESDYDKTEEALKDKPDKDEADKIIDLIQKRILDKKNFNIIISFSSKFDWTDVGQEKFKPALDEDEGWTKDDPEFKWISYNASFEEVLKRGKIDFAVKFDFKQPLLDNGSIDKNPTSSLKMTKDGEPSGLTVSDEIKVRDTLNKFFQALAEKEIPVAKGSGISVKYKNDRLDRSYVNTAAFEKQMGGLAFSNLAHGQKAQEYKDFIKKREYFLLGPPRVIEDETSEGELKVFFKGYLKNKDITPENKNKAQRYLELLKEKAVTPVIKKEMLKFENDHWQEQHEKSIKDVDWSTALK